MSKVTVTLTVEGTSNAMIEVRSDDGKVTRWSPYAWEPKYNGRFNALHEQVGGAVCRALGITDVVSARNARALVEPEETVLLYCYALTYRPPAYTHCPEGWELIERSQGTGYDARRDLPVSQYLFGVIGYRQRLSQEDVLRYELQPLGTRDVAKRLLQLPEEMAR